jgi:hypothetical protein
MASVAFAAGMTQWKAIKVALARRESGVKYPAVRQCMAAVGAAGAVAVGFAEQRRGVCRAGTSTVIEQQHLQG